MANAIIDALSGDAGGTAAQIMNVSVELRDTQDGIRLIQRCRAREIYLTNAGDEYGIVIDGTEVMIDDIDINAIALDAAIQIDTNAHDAVIGAVRSRGNVYTNFLDVAASVTGLTMSRAHVEDHTGRAIAQGTPGDNDFGSEELVFTRTGVLAVETGEIQVPFNHVGEIIDVSARVRVAPTGADIILDVNLNGTTIYGVSTNPTIAAAANTSGFSVPDTYAVAAGDYLTVDIDQIGSTIAGEDLVVIVRWVKL